MRPILLKSSMQHNYDFSSKPENTNSNSRQSTSLRQSTGTSHNRSNCIGQESQYMLIVCRLNTYTHKHPPPPPCLVNMQIKHSQTTNTVLLKPINELFCLCQLLKSQINNTNFAQILLKRKKVVNLQDQFSHF